MIDADGSSTAAPGAPSDPKPATPGLFARFLARTAGQANGSGGDGVTDAGASTSPRPGLSNLRHMQISDVAIPKGEIVAVPADISLGDLVEMFRESGFTRLPVYDGTLDNPIGMIHLKDLALRHGFGAEVNGGSVRDLVRPLLYAPPSMPIGILLQKMQSQRMHMALVIDEYGGTDGLVTIEDLIEQVIGEIEDEHDVDEDQPWTEEAPGCYVALARAPLDEFQQEVGLDLTVPDTDDEADTLGGVVFLLIGRVPARGEVITHPSGAEIEVMEADPRRIKRVRVRLPERLPEPDDG